MTNVILDFLRLIRSEMNFFSQLHFFIIPLAPLVHVVVAFFLIVILRSFFSAKISASIVAVLILLKEVADIFAKSSLENIIPPTIETPIDIVAGVIGIILAFWYIKNRQKRKAQNYGKQH